MSSPYGDMSDLDAFKKAYIERRFALNEKLQSMTKDQLIFMINELVEAQDHFWDGLEKIQEWKKEQEK